MFVPDRCVAAAFPVAFRVRVNEAKAKRTVTVNIGSFSEFGIPQVEPWLTGLSSDDVGDA